MRNKQFMNEDKRVPHYGLRKLSVGVVSVLLSTTIFWATSGQVEAADNQPGTTATANDESATSSEGASQALTLRVTSTTNSNNASATVTKNNDNSSVNSSASQTTKTSTNTANVVATKNSDNGSTETSTNTKVKASASADSSATTKATKDESTGATSSSSSNQLKTTQTLTLTKGKGQRTAMLLAQKLTDPKATISDNLSSSEEVTLNNTDTADRVITINYTANQGDVFRVTVPYLFVAKPQPGSNYTFATESTSDDVSSVFNAAKSYQNTVITYTAPTGGQLSLNIALQKALDNWSLLKAGTTLPITVEQQVKDEKGNISWKTVATRTYTIGTINQIKSNDMQFDQNQQTNLVKNNKYIVGIRLRSNNDNYNGENANGTFSGSITVKVPKGFQLDKGNDTYAWGLISKYHETVDKVGDTLDDSTTGTLSSGNNITVDQASAGGDITINFSKLTREQIDKGIIAFWGKYLDDITADENKFSDTVNYHTATNDNTETSKQTYTSTGSVNVNLSVNETQNNSLKVQFQPNDRDNSADKKDNQYIYTDNAKPGSSGDDHQVNQGIYNYGNNRVVSVLNDGNTTQTNVEIHVKVEPGSAIYSPRYTDDDGKFHFKWFSSTSTENQYGTTKGSSSQDSSDANVAGITAVTTDGQQHIIFGSNNYMPSNSNNFAEGLDQATLDKNTTNKRDLLVRNI